MSKIAPCGVVKVSFRGVAQAIIESNPVGIELRFSPA